MSLSFSVSTLFSRSISAVTTLVLLGGFLFSAVPAQAAHLSATLVSGSTNLTMQPGERTTVTLEFQNSGSVTWKNDGPGYVSLYTHGPKYRGSVFDPGTWEWGDHPGRLAQPSVAPGATGTVSFELHAPASEGTYTETFWLASEDTAWIEGGEVTLNISVAKSIEAEVPVVAEPTQSNTSAELLIQSANSINASAGRSILLTAAFKNTGATTWTNYGMVQPDVAIASTGVDFSHPSWAGKQIAYKAESVPPGGTAVIDFAFTAPQTNGTHSAQFQFAANGSPVPDAFVELPVTVTDGSGVVTQAPVVEEDDDQIVIDNPLAYVEEPDIRIGFLIVDEETDDEVVITSVYSDFELRDTEGTLLATRQKNQTVRAYYLNGVYYYDAGAGLMSSVLPLRFEPLEEDAVMRVANFDRRLTRNAKYADNEFRGTLELRHNDHKDRTWLINEVSMEYYLRGLAEGSDSFPIEFHKAQVTAARSYALFHQVRNAKYVKEFFHLTSYSTDQVYFGYGQEVRSPRITQAVEETRGVLVTVNGNPVMTPYAANTDGRSRSHEEVYGPAHSWLVSVPVPWDEGRTKWGHGVGLSQKASIDMAEEDYTWDEILKYFYTGIELTKKWK